MARREGGNHRDVVVLRTAQEGWRKLYPANPFNAPVLEAALFGRYPCVAVVDRTTDATQCVVKTNYIFTFVSPGADAQFVKEAIAKLLESGDDFGVVWPSEAPGVLPKADAVIARLEFHDLDAGARPSVDVVPSGTRLERIDAQLLERCMWRDEMVRFAGSTTAFLRQGFGVVLLRGEEILSEAYAAFRGNRIAEIGAVTAEPHRGKGYATMTTAALIEECQARDLAPRWTCNEANAASVAVARHLGFAAERKYWIHVYSPQSA